MIETMRAICGNTTNYNERNYNNINKIASDKLMQLRSQIESNTIVDKKEDTYIKKPVVMRGEIYNVYLGTSGEGSEQNGERPVLIVQNDVGNKYSPTFIGVILTSQFDKAKLPTLVEISGYGLEKDSVIHAEQIKTLDKKRLRQKIGMVDKKKMKEIETAIEISLALGKYSLTKEEKYATKMAEQINELEKVIEINDNYGCSDMIVYNRMLDDKQNKLRTLQIYCRQYGLDYKDFYVKQQEKAMLN